MDRIAFPVNADTTNVVQLRLVALGYKPIKQVFKHTSYIVIENGKLFQGSTVYPNVIANTTWGSLDLLFFSDVYRHEPVTVCVNGMDVIVTDTFDFNGHTITGSHVKQILAAYSKYNGGINDLLPR